MPLSTSDARNFNCLKMYTLIVVIHFMHSVISLTSDERAVILYRFVPGDKLIACIGGCIRIHINESLNGT